MDQQKYLPLQNKYSKWYSMLIESRQAMNREFRVGCGLEKHHIVPKSLGGSNRKDNIVVLTPREHCLAHILLVKMYSGEAKAKMCFALISLTKFRNDGRSAISTKEYDRLRSAYHAAIMDPEYRKWKSAQTKKQWTPERKASVSEKAKIRWKQGKHDYYHSEEWKQRKRQDTSRLWEDPEYRKKQSEMAQEQWAEGGSLRKIRPRK